MESEFSTDVLKMLELDEGKRWISDADLTSPVQLIFYYKAA